MYHLDVSLKLPTLHHISKTIMSIQVHSWIDQSSITNMVLKSSTCYPFLYYLSYRNLSPTHHIFVMVISIVKEPNSFLQVMEHPHWCVTVRTEIHVLESNKTWTLKLLPPGKDPLIENGSLRPNSILMEWLKKSNIVLLRKAIAKWRIGLLGNLCSYCKNDHGPTSPWYGFY